MGPNRKARLKLLRLKARALRLYGITEETFLKLTPAEYQAIEADTLRELRAEDERANRRVARIVAAIYNCRPMRRKGAKVLTEEDFMPKRRENRSGKDLLAKVQYIHNALCARAEHIEKINDGR